MLIHKLSLLLLFAIAANVDNFGVGIAYGLRRDRISVRSNLAIAIISVALTFAAMKFGEWIEPILSVQVANSLGASAIIGVGIWVFFETALARLWLSIRNRFRRQSHHKSVSRNTNPPNLLSRLLSHQTPQHISVKETLILGVSLSLNAMAGGFGASLSGHNPLFTSISVGIFSYLTLDIGQRLSGTYAGKWLGIRSTQIAGILLIAIGIYELLF